ncbi:MAG: chromosomal replication initiator protein DnaA, partial [Chloroflexota bacterium]
RDTVGVSAADGQFVVGVPTPFAAEWLSKRMSVVIERTLARVLKSSVRVSFQVHRNADADGHSLPASSSDTAADARPPAPTSAASRLGRLNPRFTFASFVVGDSNRVAHAASLSVAERPGEAYNPLFMYSGVGLGKTHLQHAIGHHALSLGRKVLYVSSERFVNDFVTAVKEHADEDFRQKYRTVDVLLVDDIQFFVGKEKTQEVFFHIFNDLHNAGCQIVVTSDRHPRDLSLLEDRLTSRLGWGLATEIYPPDYETRLAILKAKAEHMKEVIPPDILDLLARRMQRNIRDLEGALNRVVAYVRLSRLPLNLETASQALADLTIDRSRPATPDAVIQAVAAYFGMEAEALRGKRRDKRTAAARHVAMYLLKEDVARSFVEVGRLLGDRDHTTIMYGWEKIASQINTNPRMRSDVLEIRASLAEPRLKASG